MMNVFPLPATSSMTNQLGYTSHVNSFTHLNMLLKSPCELKVPISRKHGELHRYLNNRDIVLQLGYS